MPETPTELSGQRSTERSLFFRFVASQHSTEPANTEWPLVARVSKEKGDRCVAQQPLLAAMSSKVAHASTTAAHCAQQAGAVMQKRGGLRSICRAFFNEMDVAPRKPCHDTLQLDDGFDPTLHLGQRLRGGYRIERLIGSGGMAAVFRASHPHLKRPFAVKILLPRFATDSTQQRRFAQEAQILSVLDHENTVRIFDFDQLADGAPYIVMEHLRGKTLAELIRRHKRIALGPFCELVRQLCSALSDAHALGIVHRDIKPQNVFVQQASGGCSQVKLLDFGIAKFLGRNLTGVDAPDARVGSLGYMAPEQLVAGQASVDRRTDVYAVATLAFEALTGQHPLGEMSLLELIGRAKQPEASFSEPSGHVLAPTVADVLKRAMRNEQAERYPSIDAFLAAFERAARQCGRQAGRHGPSRRRRGSTRDLLVHGPCELASAR